MLWEELKELLDRILTFPTTSFSREQILDYDHKILSTDCSGIIHLLLNEIQRHRKLFKNNIFPNSYKAWQIFEHLRKTGASDNILHLSKGNIISWRKQVPPKSGDTGHLCIVYDDPKEISCHIVDHREYEIKVFEVTKSEDGPRIHIIKIQTNSTGVMLSLCWQRPKWKKVKILSTSLFSHRRPHCPLCTKVYSHCLCPALPIPKWSAPNIDIIRFPKEASHPLNSVNLLQGLFENLRVIDNEFVDPSSFGEDPILIYPSEKAIEITEEDLLPVYSRLIILDGTWKKTKRIIHQNPWLNKIRHIRFTSSKAPLYKIRKELSEHHYSTLEAYTEIWKIIDSHQKDKTLYAQNLFKEMINRQIGRIDADVYLNNYQHYPGFKE